MDNYYESFQPGENIVIIFDDKTADDRSAEQMNQMFKRIREVVNEYGFDLSDWGDQKSIYSWLKELNDSGEFEIEDNGK